MAKSYRSNFEIGDLTSALSSITSNMARGRGINSLDTREAWEKMGLKSIPGTNFTDEDIQKFASRFVHSPDFAFAELLTTMSECDSTTKKGKPSIFEKNANVTTNTLNAAKVKGDFRTLESLCSGLGKFATQVEKGAVRPDKFFGVLASAYYAKSIYDKYHVQFDKLKAYQTEIGLQLHYGDNNVSMGLWKKLGVPVERVNDIVMGRTVPDAISREGGRMYKGGSKMFDLRQTDIGKMSLNGLASVGYVANHLASVALIGELNNQLGIRQEPELTVYTTPDGNTITQENVAHFDYNGLSTEEQKTFMNIVAVNGETNYEQVSQRVSVTAGIIKDQVATLMKEFTKNGSLNVSYFSPEIQKHLQHSPDFTNDDDKIYFIETMLTERLIKAAEQGAVLGSNSEAEVASMLAFETSKSANEEIPIPAYNDDGTRKLDTHKVHRLEGDKFKSSPAYELAGIFDQSKFVFAIHYNGMVFPYTDAEGNYVTQDQLIGTDGKPLKDFKTIRAEIQAQWQAKIPDLDLSGVTEESFKSSDLLSLGLADRAAVEKSAELEKKSTGANQTPPSQGVIQPQNNAPHTPLFRSLPLYQQYVAEFRNLLEKNGLKFVISKNQDQGQDQTGGGQDQTGGDQDQTGGGQDQTGGGQDQTGGGQDQTGGGQDQTGGGQDQNPPKTPDEIKAERAEIRRQVKDSSRIYTEEGKTYAGKIALVKDYLVPLLGWGVKPEDIDGKTMTALVAKIRTNDNVTIIENLNEFCNDFVAGESELDAHSEATKKENTRTQASVGTSVTNDIEKFARDYREQFTEEAFKAELAKNPIWGLDAEKNAAGKDRVEKGLEEEALQYAAAEELFVLLSVENQGLTASEIPMIELPKIPEAAPVAGAGPIAAQDQGMGGQ